MRFYEASGTGVNYIEIKAGNVNSDANNVNYTLTLPENDGADGQVLKTDGSGVLTWATDATSASSVTNANVFGDPTDGVNVKMTFDGYDTDGIFWWMEATADAYFKFMDEIVINGEEKLGFGGRVDYINMASNVLNIVANADMLVTTGDEFKVDATDDIRLDADGKDVFIDYNGTSYGLSLIHI